MPPKGSKKKKKEEKPATVVNRDSTTAAAADAQQPPPATAQDQNSTTTTHAADLTTGQPNEATAEFKSDGRMATEASGKNLAGYLKQAHSGVRKLIAQEGGRGTKRRAHLVTAGDQRVLEGGEMSSMIKHQQQQEQEQQQREEEREKLQEAQEKEEAKQRKERTKTEEQSMSSQHQRQNPISLLNADDDDDDDEWEEIELQPKVEKVEPTEDRAAKLERWDPEQDPDSKAKQQFTVTHVAMEFEKRPPPGEGNQNNSSTRNQNQNQENLIAKTAEEKEMDIARRRSIRNGNFAMCMAKIAIHVSRGERLFREAHHPKLFLLLTDVRSQKQLWQKKMLKTKKERMRRRQHLRRRHEGGNTAPGRGAKQTMLGEEPLSGAKKKRSGAQETRRNGKRKLEGNNTITGGSRSICDIIEEDEGPTKENKKKPFSLQATLFAAVNKATNEFRNQPEKTKPDLKPCWVTAKKDMAGGTATSTAILTLVSGINQVMKLVLEDPSSSLGEDAKSEQEAAMKNEALGRTKSNGAGKQLPTGDHNNISALEPLDPHFLTRNLVHHFRSGPKREEGSKEQKTIECPSPLYFSLVFLSLGRACGMTCRLVTAFTSHDILTLGLDDDDDADGSKKRKRGGKEAEGGENSALEMETDGGGRQLLGLFGPIIKNKSSGGTAASSSLHAAGAAKSEVDLTKQEEAIKKEKGEGDGEEEDDAEVQEIQKEALEELLKKRKKKEDGGGGGKSAAPAAKKSSSGVSTASTAAKGAATRANPVAATPQQPLMKSWVWVEVYCPIRDNFISVNPCETCATAWDSPYVLAFGGDHIVEVTPRYVSKFSAVYSKRVESMKFGVSRGFLWDEDLEAFLKKQHQYKYDAAAASNSSGANASPPPPHCNSQAEGDRKLLEFTPNLVGENVSSMSDIERANSDSNNKRVELFSGPMGHVQRLLYCKNLDISLANKKKLMREALQLDKLLYSEPVPATQKALQGHPLYVLESDLGQYEAVYPNTGKNLAGNMKGTKVFKRSGICTLRTEDGWIRAGRALQDGDETEPYKVVKPPPSKTFHDKIKLYGHWQTKPCVPQPLKAEDGSIPKHRNTKWYLFLGGRTEEEEKERKAAAAAAAAARREDDNVGAADGEDAEDAKFPTLPPGLVRIVGKPKIQKIANKMDVDFGYCVIGFYKKQFTMNIRGSLIPGTRWEPTIAGIVVKSEVSEKVTEAYDEWVMVQAAQEAQKRRERAMKNWHLYIKRMIAKSRLEAQFLNDMMMPSQ